MANYISSHTGQQIDDAIDAVVSKESVWDGKQDKLTAGTGIAISGNVISATGGGGGAVWGSITGTLSDQTDLKDELDGKATPADITAAINDLNKSGSPHTNQYISVVRQSAGVIDTQSATLPMHTAGNGIQVSSGTVSAKLGSGLSFDANGAIQATGGGGSYPDWIDDVPSANQDILKGTPNRFTYLANSYTIPSSGEPYWVKSEVYLSSLKSKGLVTTDGFDDYMSKADIQKTLVAGSGISIAADGKTISATGSGSVEWGSITGTLSDQTDLKSALDAKQGTITDVADSAVKGQLVTAVSQADGGISVSRSGAAAFNQGGNIGIDGTAFMLHCDTATSNITRLSYAAMLSWVEAKIEALYGFNDTSNKVVTSGSTAIKIAKVAALPASPDPNTLYLISE